MDYKEKYNEALKRAREIKEKIMYSHLSTESCEAVSEYIDTIIPELRESEDERIRKWLILQLKTNYKGNYNASEAIAWLEKQKYDRMKPIYDAQESFESALEKAWNDYHNGYEKVDSLEDDYVECAHAKGFREGFLFGLEKQKEEEGYEAIPVESTLEYKLGFKAGKESEKQKEQKQDSLIYDKDLDHAAREFYLSGKADSPVDSTGLVPIVRMAEFGATWMKERMEKEQKPEKKFSKEEYVKKFKALCDAYEIKLPNREYDIYHLCHDLSKLSIDSGEQKPAEWSEEDEKMFEQVVDIVYDYCPDPVAKYKLKDWLMRRLKSLKPQYHGDVTMTEAYKMGLEAGKASSWKPSEEQMKALLNAEGFLRAGLQHDSAKTIAELYEQLKKLI